MILGITLQRLTYDTIIVNTKNRSQKRVFHGSLGQVGMPGPCGAAGPEPHVPGGRSCGTPTAWTAGLQTQSRFTDLNK